MAKKTKNKNQIQFKKLKKNNVGLSIFIQLLIFVMIVLLISLTISYIVISSVKTSLVGEYEQLYAMSRIYELSLEGGEEQDQVLRTLDFSGREYMILDAEGNIIHQNGENTCSMKGGTLRLYNESVEIYQDNESTMLSLNDDGSVDVDPDAVIHDIVNGWIMLFSKSDRRRAFAEGFMAGISVESDGDEDEYEEEEEDDSGIRSSVYLQKSEQMEEWEQGMYSYPLWFSLSFQDGEKFLVGKVYYRINEEDTLLLFVVFIFVAILVVLVLILKITNLIRDFLRQRRVINLYLTDPITKGHNWMHFLLRGEPYLRMSVNKRRNFAVVEIFFVKYRNFCICHTMEEGQKILEDLYQIIKKSLSRQEMCAHASTGTFALLLQYENEEELRKRLLKLLEDLENIDGTHKFAFHIGVKLLPVQLNKNGRPMRRKDLLLEKEYNNASSATATLEESDDSRIAYFDNKMLEEQKWLDAVQECQQEAVEKEEFKVYYQPKYNPKTRKLCGAEALIRWDSPKLGFVSPGRFIPIFEKNGFITEIDHYMITHVARDQKRWLDEGLECVPVSVNVSRAHFIEKDLASQICQMVDEAGTPHHLIEIELTESAFFDDKNAMINTILKLKEYGFTVSMDDFGSGYSSLNSLKDMPLDVLKLDAEFFRGQNAGERGEKVVSEAIKLARSLNMKTVAEGVEEKEQVKFLADNECDMIQGFYYAKPLPQNDYMERMKLGYAVLNDEEVETTESEVALVESQAPESEVTTAVESQAQEHEVAVVESQAPESEVAVVESTAPESDMTETGSENEKVIADAATETGSTEVGTETAAAENEIVTVDAAAETGDAEISAETAEGAETDKKAEDSDEKKNDKKEE